MRAAAPLDWRTAAFAAGAAVLTWLATSGRRAIRNIGKTEQEIRDAELLEALKRAEKAHANSDPSDDAAADADVARAREALRRAKFKRAFTDAFGEDDDAR